MSRIDAGGLEERSIEHQAGLLPDRVISVSWP